MAECGDVVVVVVVVVLVAVDALVCGVVVLVSGEGCCLGVLL